MDITIYFAVGIIAAALIAFGILEIMKAKKSKKQTPIIYMGTKIFLTDEDKAQFERSTREEKRRAVNKYKSAIKKGYILPVYEKGEIIGYVSKTNK